MTLEEAMNSIIDALPDAGSMDEALGIIRESTTADSDTITALTGERDTALAERDDWRQKYEDLDAKYRARFKEEFTGDRAAGMARKTDDFGGVPRIEDLDIFNGRTE